MRQISDHVFAEFFFWGCNPGYLTTSDGVFMIDTPQQPIDAVRWREHLLEQGPIRHLVNTEPHIDHIAGNAYFPGVEVIGQRGMLPRYEEMVPRMDSEDRRKQLEEQDPNSSWLVAHPEYPPNPPTRLFDESLSLTLGGQSIEIIHHPGHTPPQTSVWLPGEGVIFTGDNVFHHVKTFVQEADPWQWLESLEAIRALDPAIIVPGHGEPCTTAYLSEQAEIVQAWVDAVEQMVREGVTQAEARDLRPSVDPYRIGQRLFPIEDSLNTRIIDNLYPRVAERLNAAGK